MKETLFFSKPYHLKIANKQLTIIDKEQGTITQRSLEDLGLVILEHVAITFTQQVMSSLAHHGVAVIYCDNAHYPCAMLLNLAGHHIQSLRFHQQINSSLPLKKQLWKQTIQAKIHNQQALLQAVGALHSPLPTWKSIESGDATNQEAQAARIYWPALFGPRFRRGRKEPPPNHALNYGYAILRSATARALTGAGLLPMLGIHHKNKYSTFCLADDIMEPYRPFVDRRVYQLVIEGMEGEQLTQKEKAHLLNILPEAITLQGQQTTLMRALQQTATSLAQCFAHEKKKITYPKL